MPRARTAMNSQSELQARVRSPANGQQPFVLKGGCITRLFRMEYTRAPASTRARRCATFKRVCISNREQQLNYHPIADVLPALAMPTSITLLSLRYERCGALRGLGPPRSASGSLGGGEIVELGA
ncbi:hypothetical protein R1flu_010815 [Riccia fluitans]|uniref:Ribosomal protein S14 n=1 Tax=Riccia fluitans TaxID=41844 RepID=A0ABD1Z616_9MARC